MYTYSVHGMQTSLASNNILTTRQRVGWCKACARTARRPAIHYSTPLSADRSLHHLLLQLLPGDAWQVSPSKIRRPAGNACIVLPNRHDLARADLGATARQVPTSVLPFMVQAYACIDLIVFARAAFYLRRGRPRLFIQGVMLSCCAGSRDGLSRPDAV